MCRRVAALVLTFAGLFLRTPLALACDSDTECKGERICEQQICVTPRPPAPNANAAPAPLPPPPVLVPHLHVSEAPDVEAARFLVMRNPRLRSAGISLVVIGVLMEVVGTATLIGTIDGPCSTPTMVRQIEPVMSPGTVSNVPVRPRQNASSDQCLVGIEAGSILMGLGFPVIANGAWMWPVGGAMVPQEQASTTTAVKPYFAANRDGGGFGLQLAF